MLHRVQQAVVNLVLPRFAKDLLRDNTAFSCSEASFKNQFFPVFFVVCLDFSNYFDSMRSAAPVVALAFQLSVIQNRDLPRGEGAVFQSNIIIYKLLRC